MLRQFMMTHLFGIDGFGASTILAQLFHMIAKKRTGSGDPSHEVMNQPPSSRGTT